MYYYFKFRIVGGKRIITACVSYKGTGKAVKVESLKKLLDKIQK